MSEASPICRGKNLTFETVLAFVNAMPKQPLPKKEFHSFAEERLKGWTQTHSQIARQLALYYEANDICYPRFTTTINKIDLFKYMENWAQLYFVPNPYTPSLGQYRPKCIYASLIDMYKNGITSFDEACKGLFHIELNNLDKVKVYLNNFTNLVIDGDKMSVNTGLNEVGCTTDENPSIILSTDTKEYYDYFSVSTLQSKTTKKLLDAPLQQIFFGAPGTGKSYEVKHESERYTNSEHIVRTTFHPDSDYSTFVGAYKPTLIDKKLISVFGTSAKQILDEDKKPMSEKVISYQFVGQAFLKAYIDAWNNREEPEYLIIEEINRGNCAQIFGDLFQLLDRGDDGYSEYAIKTDQDMELYLAEKLADAKIEDYPKVKNGKEMVLPCNLFIRATMNTSDQSLFPIDSAFKRRWDWKYIPIVDARKDYKIEADGVLFDWWSFVIKINDEIAKATSSEDKKLGYFFCKAKDGIISADTFVGKVIFYLYNDVFKDAEDGLEALTDEEGNRMSFDKFYTTNVDGLSVVDVKTVRHFLDKMHVDNNTDLRHQEVDMVNEDNETVIDDDLHDDLNQNIERDKSQYSINGKGEYIKRILPSEALKLYISGNKEMEADDVIEDWKDLSPIPRFIEKDEDHFDATEGVQKKSIEVWCANNTRVWISNQWTVQRINLFINNINAKNWGIHIEKIQ